MMKNNSIFLGWQKIILALVVLFCGLLKPAFCQMDGPALLIQQMPAKGGTITPGEGVHHYKLNESVTLQAIPKTGYQFVYWLGDVSNPTSNRTTIYLNAPKIVVAVFERTGYALEEVTKMAAESIPGGFHGGMTATAADYARRGAVSAPGGRKRPSAPTASKTTSPEPSDEIPVPIPEPATVMLLAFGGFLAFAGRRPKKLTRTKPAIKR